MTAGTGIFLIVVGAIIRYALDIEVAGVDEGTLGLILILAGVAVLLLSLVFFLATRRRPATVVEEPVATRRAVVEDPADPRYRRY
jgi:Domain of unknown function (DUF6458)